MPHGARRTYHEIPFHHRHSILQLRPQIPRIKHHAHDALPPHPPAKLRGQEQVLRLAHAVGRLLVLVLDGPLLVEVDAAGRGVEINRQRPGPRHSARVRRRCGGGLPQDGMEQLREQEVAEAVGAELQLVTRESRVNAISP